MRRGSSSCWMRLGVYWGLCGRNLVSARKQMGYLKFGERGRESDADFWF